MKVGEYIHYKYSDYLKYGLNSSGKEKNFNPIDALNTQRNRILHDKFLNQTVSKGKKKQIEEQINFFFSLENNKHAFLDTSYAQIMPQIQEFAEKLAYQTAQSLTAVDLSKYIIDYTSGKVITSESQGSITFKDKEVQQRFSNLLNSSNLLTTKNGRSKEYATVWQINERIKALLDLRNHAQEWMETSDVNGQKFLDQLNKIMIDYEEVVKDIEKAAEIEAREDSKIAKYKGIGYDLRGIYSEKRIYANDSKIKSFAEALQGLLDKTKQVSAVYAQGVLGEVIPIVSQYLWQNFQSATAKDISTFIKDNLTNQEINIDLINTLKSQIVGKQRSKKVGLTDYILAPKSKNEIKQVQLGKMKLKVSATQDKVDIILDLNQPSGGVMSASVKAVGMRKNINILSGHDLLKYIQDYPEFVNHYLNITARIGVIEGGEPGYSTYRKAHNTMLLTIAMRALSGGVMALDNNGQSFRSAQTPYIIVNNVNTSAKGYKIYYISELLQKIKSNIDLFNLEGYEEVKLWENRWVGDINEHSRTNALRRITQILSQLQAEDLRASISPQLLI